jgi:hypothetical protein
MKNIFRSRGHRNSHKNEEQKGKEESPFFAAGEDKTKASPFFDAKPSNPVVQTKLKVGAPNDPMEQEADAVANKVVDQSSSTPAVQQKETKGIQRTTLATPAEDEKLSTAEQRTEKDKLIQEKPEEEETVQKMDDEESVQKKEDEEPVQMKEEEEAVQAKPEEEEVQKKGDEEEEIQAKGTGAPSTKTASSGLSQLIKSKAGSGHKMSNTTRAEMESGIGTDFSGVNIHTDREAAEMNQSLNAQAFTHGKDVYFNEGKYNPETSTGKRLLAHELTHVVQQSDKIQRYRNSGAPNFGVGESSFNIKTDKNKKPWVSKIYVTLNKKTVKDKNGQDTHKGTLVAKYFSNKHKLADISFPVTAGSTVHKSSVANHKVHRIEGAGYMSSAYSGAYTPDPSDKRYNITKGGNMNYAIFYKGAQAIHDGFLDEASHGCLHVDNGKLINLNHHSVVGLTAVIVKYV